MEFKKRKDFTPRKEDRTFSKRRKSKSINKEPFPVSLFVYFFVSLFKLGKIQIWLSSTIQQFDF